MTGRITLFVKLTEALVAPLPAEVLNLLLLQRDPFEKFRWLTRDSIHCCDVALLRNAVDIKFITYHSRSMYGANLFILASATALNGIESIVIRSEGSSVTELVTKWLAGFDLPT